MLDEYNHKFYWDDGVVISLTQIESEVLELLIWRKGKVTTAKYLNKLVFNEIERRPPYQNVHNCITRLRDKLRSIYRD